MRCTIFSVPLPGLSISTNSVFPSLDWISLHYWLQPVPDYRHIAACLAEIALCPITSTVFYWGISADHSTPLYKSMVPSGTLMHVLWSIRLSVTLHRSSLAQPNTPCYALSVTHVHLIHSLACASKTFFPVILPDLPDLRRFLFDFFLFWYFLFISIYLIPFYHFLLSHDSITGDRHLRHHGIGAVN